MTSPERLPNPDLNNFDMISWMTSRLVNEIRTIGHKEAPFDIQPHTILPPQSLRESLGAQALISDHHLVAKLAMDTHYAATHGLSVWFDEMPGKVTMYPDGSTSYDNTPPLYVVQNNIRIVEPPKIF